MQRLFSVAIFLFGVNLQIHSQDSIVKPVLNTDKTSIGLGFGLDFSGFGTNLSVYPIKQLGLYGGLGSPNASGIGYSAGIKLRPILNKHKSLLVPAVIAMYGYQASVFVVNATEYNKIFNGFSLGFGADGFRKPGKNSYFSAYFVLPFRNNDAQNYIYDLRRRGVQFKNPSLPDVTFSLAFRFIISRALKN